MAATALAAAIILDGISVNDRLGLTAFSYVGILAAGGFLFLDRHSAPSRWNRAGIARDRAQGGSGMQRHSFELDPVYYQLRSLTPLSR
jgi:hypothetical protein